MALLEPQDGARKSARFPQERQLARQRLQVLVLIQRGRPGEVTDTIGSVSEGKRCYVPDRALRLTAGDHGRVPSRLLGRCGQVGERRVGDAVGVEPSTGTS
jgi:hypothetical protein